MTTELEQLTRHMAWADATIWRTVVGADATAADARIRGLLHHLHTVQWVYLQLLRGESLDVPGEEAFTDAEALWRWASDYHREAPGFLAGLDEGALDAHVEMPWAERLAERYGAVHPVTVRQALLQVASHSTYHRGQVNTRIREVGGEPPLTDFVAWVWIGRPPPEWPEPRA